MKRITRILLFCLVIILFVGCRANPTESSTEYATKVSELYTQAETSAIEITENTIKDTTETTEHNPVYYMRCIEADGTLPDGEYIIFISEFDEDYFGATCSIVGYYSFTSDELLALEDGDTVYIGDIGYTFHRIEQDTGTIVAYLRDDESNYIGFDVYCLNDDFFYLRSMEDESIPSYSIYSEYHLDFSSDVEIWDLYSKDMDMWNYAHSADEDVSYGIGGHKFKDVQEFEKLLEEVREWHLEFKKQYPDYYDFTDWCVDIHATVINGTVVYMRTHPNMHQDWVPYEVRMRYAESE